MKKIKAIKNILLLFTFVGITSTLFAQIPALDKTTCIPGTIGGGVDVSPSGAANYSLPIMVSPGSHGMQPNLSIVYSSQSGNGLLGWGWNIGGLSSISRVPKNSYYDNTFDAIKMNSRDAFSLDGVRLINTSSDPIKSTNTYYPSNNPYTKVVYDSTSNIFTVTSQDGMVMEYGKEGNSLVIPYGIKIPVSYGISRVTDPEGNYIQFVYEGSSTSGEYRISEIKYTGNASNAPYNSIRFIYATRTDIESRYVAGGKLTQGSLLTSIKVSCEGSVSKEYGFTYLTDQYSKLNKISLTADGVKYNPTVINWGTSTVSPLIKSDLQLGSLGQFQLYSGDFNGDGRIDFARWNRADWNGTNVGTMQVSITQPGGGTTTLPPFNLVNGFYTSRVVPLNVIVDDIKVVDLNNDGIDEILVHFRATSSVPDPANVSKPNSDASSSSSKNIPFAKSGSTNHEEDYVYQYTLTNGTFVRTEVCKYIDDHKYKHFYGDINGDGAVERLTSQNEVLFNCSDPTITIPTTPVPIAGEFIDFDGDGRMDMLFKTSETSYSIWGYNGSTIVKKYGGETPFISNDGTYFGDFNGDGKTDYLTYNTRLVQWQLFYSTGISFVKGKAPSGLINIDPAITGTFNQLTNPLVYNKASTICIDDINNDGKADICQAVDGTFRIFYSDGEGFLTSATYSDPTKDFNNSAVYLQAIDIDNDGQKEFIYGNDQKTATGSQLNKLFCQIRFPNLISRNNLVNNIVDGLSNQFTFTYTTFSDNRQFTPAFLKPTYPLMLVRGPWQLVKQLARSSAGAATVTSEFTYEDGYTHLGGLGFLGFKMFTAKNLTTSISSTSTVEYTLPGLTGIYSPWLKEVKTDLGSTAISTQTTTEMSTLGGNTAQKFFRPVVMSSAATDYLKGGIITSTSNTYNANQGRQTGQTVSAGNWTITSSNTFGSVPGFGTRLESTTTSKTNETVTHTSSTTFIYDGSTRRVKGTTDQNGVSTSITSFDSFGNPKGVSVTSGGITRSTSCAYDDKGRFVKESTDALGNTSKADYRPADGAKLWDENSLGKRTTYTYTAGNGAMVATVTSPDGNIIISTLGWSETGMYSTQKKLNGTVLETYYFNSLGQTVKEESTGYKDATLTTTYKYNADGTLYSSTMSGIATPTTYSYDSYARPTKVTGANTDITYTYSGLSVKVEDKIAGVDQTKYYDVMGYLKRVTGKMGEIVYINLPTGAVQEIQAPGGTTRMEYDARGNQTKLDDPDAGIAIYEYNGFNQLLTQTDARGKKITCGYEANGLLSTKSGAITSESYLYSTASGKKGQLTSATRNGITESYTYDDLGRLHTATTVGALQTLTTTNEYNSIGELYRVTQPTGLILQFDYDNARNLQAILSLNSDNSTSLIWEGTAKNSRGQWDNFKMGNNLVTKWGYNPTSYLLESIKTGIYGGSDISVQNLTYGYNTKNQLNQRKDGTLTEDFTYDDQNRLLKSTIGSKIMESTYSVNGNISSTTIAGTYSYDAGPKHAVSSVVGPSNTTGQSPAFITTSTFTDDNKLEGMDNGTYKNTFTYGPSGNRFKVDHFVKSNGTYSTTPNYSKIYVNNNEFILNGSGVKTKSRTLIYAPTGICAVWEKNETNGVDSLHYIHTDNQGSWLKITNKNGAIENTYSYDAWGRPRDPSTWDLLPVNINNALTNLSAMQPRFDRGYTGHEHMAGFGLINMNGRLYDPYLQRFLSPDNFVQDPTNAQNYNRYSYCVNNPLMYTDPSGWQMAALSEFWNMGGEFNCYERLNISSDLHSGSTIISGGGGLLPVQYVSKDNWVEIHPLYRGVSNWGNSRSCVGGHLEKEYTDHYTAYGHVDSKTNEVVWDSYELTSTTSKNVFKPNSQGVNQANVGALPLLAALCAALGDAAAAVLAELAIPLTVITFQGDTRTNRDWQRREDRRGQQLERDLVNGHNGMLDNGGVNNLGFPEDPNGLIPKGAATIFIVLKAFDLYLNWDSVTTPKPTPTTINKDTTIIIPYRPGYRP